ncbi:MAG: 3-isopropylmalate dehydratase small subunit [Gemmatimonadales bacterium]
MQPFVSHTGRVAALDRANVDTDQIIPKQFLKRIERTGFGAFLFYDWRYRSDGTPNPGFELNRVESRGATVLLTGENFGCGSSREHAPWALADFGFRTIIAPSFADIFYSNCMQNGLLPVVLPEAAVADLFRRCAGSPGYEVTVDLEGREVRDAAGFRAAFEIADYQREMLLLGLDEIGRTLLDEPLITAYERK